MHFEDGGNKSGIKKIALMSKDIVNIMTVLSKNRGLVELLVNDIKNPHSKPVTEEQAKKIVLVGSSDDSKISPLPFSPDVQQTDSSFIRIYYNIGEIDSSEAFMVSEIHIDIIIAKSLWLINDGKRSLIRPYEIMGRVIDLIGRKSARPIVKFNGFQHLAVNERFDAIRLFAENFNVQG